MPDEVLAKLTDPEAIARWSPVSYELLEFDGDRLRAGSRARVRGALAGRPLEFTVDVHQAHDGRLALLARGPVSIAAEYLLHPVRGGSRLRASVTVTGRGLFGFPLARGGGAAGGGVAASIGGPPRSRARDRDVRVIASARAALGHRLADCCGVGSSTGSGRFPSARAS
jgi:hypothetical protein